MTTKGRHELQELVTKWRDAATEEFSEYRNTQYASALDQCADELEAALRAHPDLRAWHKDEKNDDHARVVTMGEGTDSRTASTDVAGSVDLPTPNQVSNEP